MKIYVQMQKLVSQSLKTNRIFAVSRHLPKNMYPITKTKFRVEKQQKLFNQIVIKMNITGNITITYHTLSLCTCPKNA